MMDHQAATGIFPIVLFPGLGTDERLFARQKERFPGLIVPRWLEHRQGESLVRYAERSSEQLAHLSPFWVGGSSFGGMLALEVSRYVPTLGVVLIGSSRTPLSIAPLCRILGSGARHLPAPVYSTARRLAPAFVRSLFPRSPDAQAIAAASSPSVPSRFVRWGLGAILDWPGLPELRVPIHHVHGDRDRIIPLSRVDPDRVVRGAGHLLALTHGHALNDYLAKKTGL